MRFYNIFFSPTGGTEKVADIVAKGTKLDTEEIDLIKEPDKLMKVKFEKKGSMFGCCTVLRWTHSISCNGYVPQSKGRWYEDNSCGSIWKPYD